MVSKQKKPLSALTFCGRSRQRRSTVSTRGTSVALSVAFYPTRCSTSRLASSTVFSQLLPLVSLTQLRGVCFRSQRLRLARLMGGFLDGFLTVVAATVMLYGLRSTLLQ